MLTLGNKIIAGSFKSGASWEVGDVGISAFGIDEALNKRRYLNGQVISQAQFVEFTAMLKSRVSVYPNLATTEVNWQAEVTNSKLGQCGKFVIDDDASTIRLPKVVNINGLQDLTGLGGIKAESLPNIKGTIPNTTWQQLSNYYSGVAQIGDYIGGFYGGGSAYGVSTINLNASNSSSTYQDNAPVQQEAIQYPYFIQVATGVETSVDVSREIELNNPFSLLDYKYSEYEISNASWLLSNGQWNSGAVYQSVYDLLLQIYNGTVTKAGVSVKLSTEAYADTDFVLNTTDTTFRLPLKVKLPNSKGVAGNGKTLGFTDGTSSSGIGNISGSGFASRGNPGDSVGQAVTSQTISYTMSGIVTDASTSGIEVKDDSSMYLYFYVGETVQDANIIAAGQALTDIADLKNASNFSDAGKSTIAGWSMPSSRYIDLTLGASGSTYTAPANGWVFFQDTGNQPYSALILRTDYIRVSLTPGSGGNGVMSEIMPVKKGDIFYADYVSITGGNRLFRFVYAEGEN